MDTTTVGGIVDRLEKAGLVQRRPAREDRRMYGVWLTEKGRRAEGDLMGAAIRVRERMEQVMQPREYKQLRRLLNKLATWRK